MEICYAFLQHTAEFGWQGYYKGALIVASLLPREMVIPDINLSDLEIALPEHHIKAVLRNASEDKGIEFLWGPLHINKSTLCMGRPADLQFLDILLLAVSQGNEPNTILEGNTLFAATASLEELLTNDANLGIEPCFDYCAANRCVALSDYLKKISGGEN
jgi:hypothetical protein